MNMFANGEITFLAATAYFAAFVAGHVLTVMLTRRFETTPPRDVVTRVKAAQRIGSLHMFKAVWFAALFTVAGITIVQATPKLPLIEVVTVYGGLIGILASIAQSAEWYRIASRAAAAHRALRHLTVHGGGVDTLVSIQLPQSVLDRIAAGEPLSRPERTSIIELTVTKEHP